MQDERERLKAAGFSDAEIDAELGAPVRPSVRMPSESTGTRATIKNASAAQVASNAQANARLGKGVARSVADGALLGFGDNAESLLFRTPIDKIRSEQTLFRKENPGTAFVSELGGGLLTGAGAAKLLTKAPAVARLLTSPTASVGRRLLTGVAGGSVAGAVGGAGKADGVDERENALKGAAVGGVAAGLLGGGAEIVKAARNGTASLLRGQATQGVRAAVTKKIEAESPQLAGARRTLRRIGRGGNTLDEVAAAEAGAAPTLSLGEVVDDATKPSAYLRDQGTQGLRIGRNMGRERDTIDASLQARAADAPDRFRKVVADAQGLDMPRDAQAFRDDVVGAAMDEAGPKFAAAAPRAVPDGALATVLDRVKKLKGQGLDLWSNAAMADDAFPEAITDQLTVGQLRTLRQELDSNITWGADARNFDSIQRKANNRLKGLRDDLDGLIKAAGGTDQQEADAVVSAAMGKAESFKTGQKAMRASTPEGIETTMAGARDAEGARLGAASDIQAKLLNVADGEGGRVSNPTYSVAGSPMKTAKLRAGLPDDAAAATVDAERAQINREFQTRQRVSGNSTTFANASEGAEEFGDSLLPAIASPTQATMGLLARISGRALSGVTADQATEMARLLGAGLPNQLPRTEALSLLRGAIPKLETAQRRSLLTGSGLGAAAGGASGRQ